MDLNYRPLVSEATALLAKPQPLTTAHALTSQNWNLQIYLAAKKILLMVASSPVQRMTWRIILQEAGPGWPALEILILPTPFIGNISVELRSFPINIFWLLHIVPVLSKLALTCIQLLRRYMAGQNILTFVSHQFCF